MSEGKEGKLISRRTFIVGGLASAAGVAAVAVVGSRDSGQDKEPLSEADQTRQKDMQTFRDVAFNLLNQDENREAFAKMFSDDFMNGKLPPTPEESNPQRFVVSKGTSKVPLNPSNKSESKNADSVSYSIRTSPHETSEQRKEVPYLSYKKNTYEGKVVDEGLSGIVGVDNKFTGQLTKGEDPKTDEEIENTAGELKDRVKKIFKFTPEQWDAFEWDTYQIVMRNTNGIPQFGVEGILQEDGKIYTVKLGKSGAVGLSVDHRPANFGFTAESYEE